MDRLTRAAGTEELECVSTSLDLFSPPYVETSIDKVYFVEYNPINAISDSANSIVFSIPAVDDYTSVCESYYEVKVQITQSNGGTLPGQTTNASYGFVNQIASSIFSSVNVKLNEQSISDSFGTYAYLSHIQALLSYSEASRKTRLRLQGYVDDVNPSSINADRSATVTGFKTRAGWSSQSKIVTLLAPIYHEFFSQGRALIPLVPMQLEFTRASNAFALLSNVANCDYVFKIKSMKLHMKRIKIIPSLKLELERKIESKPAKYPLLQCSVKPFFVDASAKSVSFENGE